MGRCDLTDFEWSVFPIPVAEEATWCFSHEPLASTEQDPVGVTLQRTVAGPAGALRPRHHLQRPPQPMAQERRLGLLTDASVEACDGDVQMIDSLSIPVHQHARGLNERGPNRCIGHSLGGLTTKLHTIADASGLPMRRDLNQGQAYDGTVAGPLLTAQLSPACHAVVIKVNGAERIRSMIRAQIAAQANSDRGNARTSHAFNRLSYVTRNRIKRFFGKLKQFRHITTRCQELAASFLIMIKIATIRTLLRIMSPRTSTVQSDWRRLFDNRAHVGVSISGLYDSLLRLEGTR